MQSDVIATLERAAQLVELDEHEILWAIEEHGRCDTDTYSVVPADGDRYIVRPR